jgi:hypothetical protein
LLSPGNAASSFGLSYYKDFCFKSDETVSLNPLVKLDKPSLPAENVNVMGPISVIARRCSLQLLASFFLKFFFCENCPYSILKNEDLRQLLYFVLGKKNACLCLTLTNKSQKLTEKWLCSLKKKSVSQTVARRLAVWQARIRISARHPRRGPLVNIKSGTRRVLYIKYCMYFRLMM